MDWAVSATLSLVIIAAVVFAVQIRRGNLSVSRYKSYSYQCAQVRREWRRDRKRVFAMTLQRSTPVAFVARIAGHLTRMARGRGAA